MTLIYHISQYYIPDSFFIIALFIEITGAMLLARSVLPKNRDILKLASSYMGWSAPLAASIIEAKIDGLFGTIALVLGFFVQVITYTITIFHPVRTNFGSRYAIVALITGSCLTAVLLSVWKVIGKWWAKKIANDVVNQYEKEEERERFLKAIYKEM